jgi:hypothetical protein
LRPPPDDKDNRAESFSSEAETVPDRDIPQIKETARHNQYVASRFYIVFVSFYVR